MVCSTLEMAKMGQRGRYLAIRWAVLPVVVMTTMAEARHLMEALTAAMAMVWVPSVGHGAMCDRWMKTSFW
uniref:Putative secreted protein n=1 Tax=Ixodes ricinus TaxID=34613 RepID=A0A6B0U2S6_IXORI